MTSFTLKEKLDCAHREVQQRRRVYARLVEGGKMTRHKADYETACMEAIADDYRAQLKARFSTDNPELFP